jgi:hypothetical protein
MLRALHELFPPTSRWTSHYLYCFRLRFLNWAHPLALMPAYCWLHITLTEGLSSPLQDLLFKPCLYAYTCYGLGVGIYMIRVPERFLPGSFDIWVHFLCGRNSLLLRDTLTRSGTSLLLRGSGYCIQEFGIQHNGD